MTSIRCTHLGVCWIAALFCLYGQPQNGESSNAAEAAAHIAQGDLYHAAAEQEGARPSWDQLAGLEYWKAFELLKDTPDPVAPAEAMIRWASTVGSATPPRVTDPFPVFLHTQLTAALAVVEAAKGSNALPVQLAKARLVLLYKGTERRDDFDRFCPESLTAGTQTKLLTACARTALEDKQIAAAESFAKRAEALFAGEPVAAAEAHDRIYTWLILAEVARKQGHLEDARKAADQAVDLCGRYLGPSSQLRAEALKTQAGVLDELKLRAESKRALKESEDITAANKKQATNPRLTNPRPLSRPEPPFPAQAEAAHATGMIMLYCEIKTDGGMKVLALMNRLGYGFEDAAIEAVQRWRFEPMKKDGQPVASSAMIEVNFRWK